MIFIGVIENKRDRITFNLIKEILNGSSYKKYHQNKKGNMVVFNKGNNHVTLIDIRPSLINGLVELGIEFNILVHTCLNEEDYKNKYLKKLCKDVEYIMLNCDEEQWISLLDEKSKGIVITYGFSNKATINPSSYNIHEYIEMNLCLQRDIVPIEGDIIEPFEFPVILSSKNKTDIYPGLAAISCSLVLGNNISENNSPYFLDGKK